MHLELDAPKKKKSHILIPLVKRHNISIAGQIEDIHERTVFLRPSYSSDVKKISKIESVLVDAMVKYNAKWLNNDLTEDDIRERFVSIVNDNGIMELATDIELAAGDKGTFAVEIKGIKVFATQFVAICKVHSMLTNESEEDDIDPGPEEREDVIQYWSKEVSGVSAIIEKQVAKMRKTVADLEELLHIASDESTKGNVDGWEDALQQVSERITAFNNGLWGM